MHELSESTKRLFDVGSLALAGVAAISLSQAALIVTIMAGIMSIAWTAMRFHDRLKYGRHSGD